MAVRAQWKGFIKVSLVSFPVSLYTATSSSDRISFNQIHKDTKQRVKLVPHEPNLGPVSREDLVKGYEYEKGKFVVIEPSELEAIKLETTKTIEIEKFVKESEIDELYVDSPYFVAPEGPVADEPFRVFVEAMRRKKVAGVARVVLSGRERIVAVKPRGKGLIMQTLRYGSEVRSEEPYFEDVGTGKVDAQMLKLAEQLIDQRFGEFDASEFSDRYGEAVLALVKSKIAGQPIEALEEEEPAAKVVSLMDALRRSVEEVEVKKKPAARSTTRRRAKKSSG
jgi:DNA end-binding protein Ku